MYSSYKEFLLLFSNILLINHHYLNRYYKLITIFKKRNLIKDIGLENHHIIPRSFSGTNKKENMVYCKFKEHYILHHLLWKAFPNTGMTHAFMMMNCVRTEKSKITAKVYEQLRSEFSKNHSKKIKGTKLSKEACKNISLGKKGKLKTKEECQRMSESRTGTIYINNGIIQKRVKKECYEEVYSDWNVGYLNKRIYSKESCENLAKNNRGKIYINNSIITKKIYPQQMQEYLTQGWTIGRLPITEETRQKYSKAKQGIIIINNGIEQIRIKKECYEELYSDWTRGKLKKIEYSQETRDKMSKSQKGKKRTEESKIKQANIQKGKIVINNEVYIKRIHPDKLQSYLDNGWHIGNIKGSKVHSIESKEKISKSNTGKVRSKEYKQYCSENRKGQIYINNGSIQKRIHPEDIINYSGWARGKIKGRLKFTLEHKNNIAYSQRQRRIREKLIHQP